jgi:hypothetical protein
MDAFSELFVPFRFENVRLGLEIFNQQIGVSIPDGSAFGQCSD